MKKILFKARNHFRFTLHNIVAHPLMEILHLLGATNLSKKVHDSTLPKVLLPEALEVQENISLILNPERDD
jgi:hypothetical protein